MNPKLTQFLSLWSQHSPYFSSVIAAPSPISQHSLLFSGEIADGVQGEFEGAEVTVNFYLHEQTRAMVGEVDRAFRLETQIIETDKYDVHMVLHQGVQCSIYCTRYTCITCTIYMEHWTPCTSHYLNWSSPSKPIKHK